MLLLYWTTPAADLDCMGGNTADSFCLGWTATEFTDYVPVVCKEAVEKQHSQEQQNK